jgi:hypothetical protein
MTDEHKDWSAVVFQPGAELIVGWRAARRRLDAVAMELSAKVAEEVHAMCRTTLDRLASMFPRPYDGFPYIETNEEYLSVPTKHMRRGSAPGRDRPEDGEPAELPDLERLIATPGVQPISREELRAGRYLFYAAICTERDSGQRIGFVRQSDPHRIAKAGGFLALLGREGLQHLEDPVFVFEADFDLVVAPGEIAVFHFEAFNRMFADLNVLVAAAPVNAKLIADVVGQMTPAAIGALTAAAAARPSLARRLQRLARDGSVPILTPKDLSMALTKHGLDPALVVADDEITFGTDQASAFLDLIEQLYYETDFTGEHRRSDRYSRLKS